MAAEVVVVVVVVFVVVIENGSITGDVESGPSDCDTESNNREVKTSSIHASIAMVSIVSFGSTHLNKFSSVRFEKINFGPTFQNPYVHVAGAHSRFLHLLTI